MATFEYTAEKDSKVLTGSLEAIDREGASKVLAKENMRIISLNEVQKSKFNLNFELSEPRVKLQDRVVFTRQLATMINAGVPLVRSLATLSQQTDSKALKRYLAEVVHDVESGEALASSLKKHPKAFDDIYVNMVAAGEEGGILDSILLKLANQQEKDAEIRGKLKSAMTYPGVILSITFVAFIFLMTTVIPKIGTIIKDLGGDDYELPVYTQVMLKISDFMVNDGPLLLVLSIIVFFILGKYIRTPKGKLNFHRVLLKIPLVGKIITKVAIARFSRTFSALSAAGVNILESLNVTANAVGNEVIKRHILDAQQAVKNGKSLSEPLSGVKLFPPILSQMIAIGEETGEIDTVLEKLADFYDQEVDQVANSLTSILEPIMIVILGSIIGVIALSVFGPISSITQSI